MHCQCSTVHHVDCSEQDVKAKTRRPGQALYYSKEEARAKRQAGPGATVRLAWHVCKLLRSTQIISATIVDKSDQPGSAEQQQTNQSEPAQDRDTTSLPGTSPAACIALHALQNCLRASRKLPSKQFVPAKSAS